MSPACEALASLFRRHPGQWLAHDVVYQAGRHNTTARLSELRNKHGFKIEQQGAGEKSQYRCVGDPGKPVYRYLRCPSCLWEGHEPQAIGAQFCPRDGMVLVESAAPKQEALFA